MAAKVHKDALWAVFRSPMSYFNSTKTGRIINRFSSDMSKIDSELTQNIQQFVWTVVGGIFSFVIVIATVPVIPLIMLPALFVYWFIQQSFRATAREIQRITN